MQLRNKYVCDQTCECIILLDFFKLWGMGKASVLRERLLYQSTNFFPFYPLSPSPCSIFRARPGQQERKKLHRKCTLHGSISLFLFIMLCWSDLRSNQELILCIYLHYVFLHYICILPSSLRLSLSSSSTTED